MSILSYDVIRKSVNEKPKKATAHRQERGGENRETVGRLEFQ